MTAPFELRRHFDPNSFERGERYHRQRRVIELNAEAGADGSIHLTAQVFGSASLPYRQDIQLLRRHDVIMEISGECSCPVGFNCKHVAAAAIAWAGRPDKASVPRPPAAPPAPTIPEVVRTLLSRMEEAVALDSGDSYPDTVRTRLLYLLRVEELPSGRVLTVQVLSVPLRKDGEFGAQDRPFNFENLAGKAPAKFVTPTDRAILSAILEQRGSAAPSLKGKVLRGDRAPPLIERMVRTGRLYWDDFHANPPLTPGPARSGRAGWVGDAEGRQRFTIAADGTDAGGTGADAADLQLLPTVPPVYIDPVRWECGTMTTDLSPHLAATLLSAPSLAPGDIQAFRDGAARFGKSLPKLPAAPSGMETRRIAPRPVLSLLQARRIFPSSYATYRPYSYSNMPDHSMVAAAELGFEYAGRRVAADQPPAPFQWMEKGILVTAERSAEDEGQAAARLESTGLQLGMTPVTVVGRPSGRYTLFEYGSDPVDSAANWLHFCHFTVPLLRAEGWVVEIDPNFPYQVVETVDNWSFDVGEGSGIDWFGLSLGIDVEGERIDLLPVLRSVIAVLDRLDLGNNPYDAYDDEFYEDDAEAEDTDPSEPRGLDLALDLLAPEGKLFVPVGGKRFLPLDVDRLRPLIGVLMELFGLQPDGATDALRIGRTHLADLAALEDAASAAGIPLLGADAVRGMARTLSEAGGVPAVPPPDGLRAVLRPYQQAGLAWLQFLASHQFGGLLADDMGLGKTVQTLAHLLVEKEAGRLDRPSVLVAPTSVLGNWRAEAQRFAPGLKVLVLHGPQRKAALGALGAYDLVVTSYALLPRDREVLAAQPWHLAIFDEAQFLKNPASQATKAAQELEARQRLCLTGTPVENNLDELWSLFSVAVPSLFGDRTLFRRQFRTPIEKHGDVERQKLLARRARPFLLRRTKEEVAQDLPPKTEIVETVEPEAAQRDLYETIRLAMDRRVRDEIARKGLARSHITILDALLKLRQACCDPRLVKLEAARKRTAKGAASAKLARLLEMLPELLADGRRILLFSQFTSMLDLLKPELEERGIAFVELTGDTKDRETPVNRFQAQEVPLFLISLRAGGTGLNLTAADTVIHYDPWWNPAVEDQATDRAHRIGQDKPVFVYKLVTAGTVEERMLALQERKRRLGEAVYERDGAELDSLTAEDVAFLLAPIGNED